MTARWHILTGEYPPTLGGVSDYARSVAGGLARAGDVVHVWAPQTAGAPPDDHGVQLHLLEGGFTPRGLVALSKGLAREPRPRRLLVQYVPHAFGMKAMNLPFCAWWAARAQDEKWAMFHEVAYPVIRGDALRYQALGVVNHVMAALVARPAARLFVSTTSWDEILAGLLPRPPRTTLLGVPSSIPTQVMPEDIARARASLPKAKLVIGHFGTYGPMAPMLGETMRMLLRRPDRAALLLGNGSREFASAEKLEEACAHGSSVVATGRLPREDVAALLATCDLVVQPFTDGITTRRTSVMASLALGVPVVTTRGHLTEPLWAETGTVVITDKDPVSLVAATEALVADAPRRRDMGDRGRALYHERFSLERTVETLRADAGRG